MSESFDSSLRILLVEDNPNDAMLVRKRLGESESSFLPDTVDLHHVESLEAAFESLDDQQFDLLLLDLGLPESSGAKTYARAREEIPSLPIVVLTALKDEETAVELLQQGAQDYVNKSSLTEEKLVKSVRYAMERQERKQQLQTRTEQLEVLTRILRHDISNDTQVLQIWSHGLLEKVDEQHKEDVQKILQTVEHIQELTTNTKAFIETITGTSDLETKPIRLDNVLRDELQKARSRYEKANFLVGEFPAVVIRANGLLSSVFRNLLNNAVQHADGKATVAVAVEANAEMARVTITDNGPGVPDDRKDEIFGKGDRGLESEGTGIGLYLVYTLVTAFGGDVWVEDRPDDGSGAAFVVELPTTDETAGWAVSS